MYNRYSLKFVLTLVFSASALTCVIFSLLFYFHFGSLRPVTQRAENTNEFTELLNVISNRFIGNFDLSDITDAAMRAAVDSLEDDWSFYMNAEEYTEYLATADNRYTGIGVEVNIEAENGVRVVGVYRNSGADIAGMRLDDLIIAVDGENIIGLSLIEIRALLRRPLGDSAVLTVIRNNEELDLTVLYNIVFIDPVTFEMLDNNIGYVILQNFEADAGNSFIAAVNELIEQGAVGFIYDVRSNNGGRVGEVTQILDFLLPEGEIFITVNRGGAEQITWSDANFIDIPAVVLVNSFSYSGAEFFAAMLSEYDYAPTVGEPTTGKNRMQTTIRLSNGGAVHLSTGHYLTKNRVSLFDTGGFTPDHVVEFSEKELELFMRGELELSEDRQLQMALSLLAS